MKLIALYKAYTGGEWFETSLDSIANCVDGIVVTMCTQPWLRSLDLAGDCEGPLDVWTRAHPDTRVSVVRDAFRDQGRQYEAGLAAVREQYGEGASVLVVDTDEVWEPTQIASLRAEIEAGWADYYCSRVYTYLKSPQYRVWPTEGPNVVVGLRNAAHRHVQGRFSFYRAMGSRAMHLDGVAFHHFPYVRLDDEILKKKFLNTSSQEHVPSDFTWFERIWGALPAGSDLHMSLGYENVWKEIKVLPEQMLPPIVRGNQFCRLRVQHENGRWRQKVQRQYPEESIWAQPDDRDVQKYEQELREITNNYQQLVSRLKCTVLEALVLALTARDVPAGGRVLEIGSGSGGSMACLALGAPEDATFVSVDPFEPYDETTTTGTARGVREGDEGQFHRTAAAFGFANRVENVRLKSADAADQIEDGSCDLVFVDGNHTHEVVLDDLRRYWPKVKSGGLLMGHDYSGRFNGVIQAVDEWEGRVGGIEVPAGTTLFLKRKDGFDERENDKE